MKKKLVILVIISSVLIYIMLFFNNFNKSRANDEGILAAINGQKITITEFNKLKKIFRNKDSTIEGKRKFLDRIIACILTAAKANEIGLHEDPIIKQKVKAFRDKQLFSLMKKQFAKPITLDDNIDKNIIPEHWRKKIRFREIVVQDRPEAEQIRKDILNGRDFESLAREKSINKYSKNGGDTGFVMMGMNTFSVEVENIISKLEIGQISEIIKTREGYGIFKAIEKKNLTDEERKKVLMLSGKKLNTEKLLEFIEKLRSQAKIKIFSDNVEKIQDIKYSKEDYLQIELFSINGEIIRLVDILSGVENLRFDSLRLRKGLTTPYLNYLIENKIVQTLLVDEARRIGLNKDPEFENIVKRFEERHLTLKYFADVLYTDTDLTTCTEKEIKTFYEEYKDSPQYRNISECVHARQILVERESTAKEILKRLKNRADFVEMAKNYSILRIHQIGGDLGYLEHGCSKTIKRTPMTKDEEGLIFSLPEGEISDIIKVYLHGIKKKEYEFYSIIKIEDRIKEGADDYNEIKGLIKSKLLEQKRKDFITQLKSKASIKIRHELINSL